MPRKVKGTSSLSLNLSSKTLDFLEGCIIPILDSRALRALSQLTAHGSSSQRRGFSREKISLWSDKTLFVLERGHGISGFEWIKGKP